MLKRIFVFTFVIMVILSLSSCMDSFNYSTGTSTEEYNQFKSKVYYSDIYMPDISEFDGYSSWETTYAVHNMPLELFDVTDSVTLILMYDDTDAYIEEKNKVDNKYSYILEPTNTLYDVSAVYKGYDIKIVDENCLPEDKPSFDYPHYFLMVGYDDVNLKISILYHYDSEIDYIRNLDSFIEESFYL